MEHYTVSNEGINKADDKETTGSGFSLLLFLPEEWGFLDKYPGYSEYARLISKTGILKQDFDYSSPVFELLSPSLIYICYSDFDSDGKSTIIFLLSPNQMALLDNGRVNRQRITDWAQNGLLNRTSDLAQLLGMDVLEHHQQQLEQFEDQMDRIEEGILDSPRKWQMVEIMGLHKKIIGLKKSLNAHETIFGRLASTDKAKNIESSWKELIAEAQRGLENARQTHELVISLREAYQQAMDNHANDIMKVLTLLATILLPINLITSFFGMNFKNMPLIDSPWGINVFFLISVVFIVIVLVLFWRKRWLR